MRPCPACNSTDATAIWTKSGYQLMRCAACGLVFVGNPPTPEQLARIYSFEAGYHTNFRDNPAEIRYRTGQAQQQLSELSRFAAPPGRVLDVGASAGFFILAAADHGWDASGIELSADTAQLAQRRGANVTCGTLRQAPIKLGSLDAITMWDVIEHVERPREELDLARHLVRPGGILAISTPNLDGWYPRLSYRVRQITKVWPAVEPPYHLSQFSVRTLSRLLAATGWEVLSVRHYAQSLGYSFGSLRTMKSPKRLLFAAVFAPVAWLGPKFRAGDEISVIARCR